MPWASAPTSLSSYIDFIADRRLAGCGLPALSPGVTNPLPWLAEMMDIRKEQNFFEGRVTDYQKSSQEAYRRTARSETELQLARHPPRRGSARAGGAGALPAWRRAF
jgi:hypothetical protein